MKILNTFILLFVCYFYSLSQNNDIVVYSLESEPFYVVVNGIRQNVDPATNVRVKNLNGEFHRLRIIFANEQYSPVDQSINFFEQNTEVKIEMIFKRGSFKARFMGENKKVDTPNESQQVIDYNSERINESNTSSTETKPINQSTHENNQENNSSSSTSIKLEVSEKGVKTEIKQSGIYENRPTDGVGEVEIVEGYVNDTYRFMPNGSMCSRPTVTQEDYMKFRYGIEEENMFNREKFIIQFFSENCMTSAQVAGIVQMDYSTVKPYEIAKSGYRYTWDTENYSLVIASLKNKSEQQKLVAFLDVGVEGGVIESPSIDQSETEIDNSEVIDFGLIDGYAGGINCSFNEFVDGEAIKKAADAESFSAEKIQVIRLKSQNKCFTVKDVKLISETFTHETDKIDFLELVFYNTYDVADYYEVVDVLTHSASKEKVAKFVSERSNKRKGMVKSKNMAHEQLNYDGKVGSSLPLINKEKFINTLSNQVFKKDKMTVINLALTNYSLTTNQFIESAQSAFTSEKDILEFARFAQSNIYDIDNFYQVREILQFNSSKKEFDELLNK